MAHPLPPRLLLSTVARCTLLLAALAAPAVLGSLVACDPVKMPAEMPGPPGCGMRDPRDSGPSTMSVAQNTVIRNMGHPSTVEPNEAGGRTWVYFRQSGSVFGESETAEIYTFDAQGLLAHQKTELRHKTGK